MPLQFKMSAIKYKKLSHVEQILLRPDTYVNSAEVITQDSYVLSADGSSMETAPVTMSPALLSLFNEAVANAFDHTNRELRQPVTEIRFSASDKRLSVRNSGDGIDVVMHEKEKVWTPELIFGHLLTSSNYDDTEKRVTGGRNGYGIKLVNVFSKWFRVETVDTSRGKRYIQEWSDNMSVCNKPHITSVTVKNPYTEVSWEPDAGRLGAITPSALRAFERRAIEVAACVRPGVKVYWNDTLIKTNTLAKFAGLFVSPIMALTLNERWSVVVGPSPTGKPFHVSFVNGLSTTEGGTHVTAIQSQIRAHLQAHLASKLKREEISGTLVDNAVGLWISALIENPTFSSQTKEKLTMARSKFGPKAFDPVISAEDLKKVVSKLPIASTIADALTLKSERDAAKTDGKKGARLRGIHGLEDAAYAGTSKSKDCFLIVCEGDSAKAMAMSGLTTEQRNYIGLLPLKGKVLNVKGLTLDKIHSNTEIVALKSVLGLETKKEYTDTRSLRYGKFLLIMTDQDYDGSHIRGLLLNLFAELWPSLLKLGYIRYMATPIVKVTKGPTVKEFFNLSDYEAWKAATPGSSSWRSKYYKGLGTFTKAEAQPIFRSITDVPFVIETPADLEDLDMAFEKGRAGDRKEWMGTYDSTAVLDHKTAVRISDFVSRDLSHFAHYSLDRAIPSIVDGLKVSQRKILYAALRFLKGQEKVAQFAATVAKETAYHHGEAALQEAVIAMAQDFVGSNNINLLLPEGQFGTRLMGGKDHSASRYIFTDLNPVARKIFNPRDLPVLKYLDDDGTPVEPEWFIPVIPMVLINGAVGIAEGYSTSIPSWDPEDIKEYLRLRLAGIPMPDWDPTPFWAGFKGRIEPISGHPGSWEMFGVWSVAKDGITVDITELPVGTWTNIYKAKLEKLEEEKKIATFESTSNDDTIRIKVTLNAPLATKELVKLLDLSEKISTSNMHLQDSRGRIKKYGSAREIVEEFLPIRLEMYARRKVFEMGELDKKISRANAIVRFIELQLAGTLELRNKPLAECTSALATHGLAEHADYLLDMPFRSITREKVAHHRKQLEELAAERAVLAGKTPETLWLEELE